MAGLTVAARQEAFVFAESRMIRTTVNSLFRLMGTRFKEFPANYLVFDVETTGFKVGEDLIAELGYVLVRNHQPVDQGWVYLDWTNHPGVDQGWLQDRIDFTRRHIELRDGRPTGRTYHVSYDKLSAGMEPCEALRRYEQLFLNNRAEGYFCVAHNGYHFDVPFIEEHLATFIDSGFRFTDHELVDTGMIEKGAQGVMTPWVGETPRDFSLRVSKTWLKGVYWALDSHCVPKYKLNEKAGIKVAAAHDAAVDSLLTHVLFEEYRKEAEGTSCSPMP